MKARTRTVSPKRELSGLMFAGALAAICTFSTVGTASAAGFFQNYQVNTDFDVRHIALYQATAPNGLGGGLTNSFNVSAPGTTITDPFLKFAPITATYFLGVSDLVGQISFSNDDEQPPERHLILALNEAFAASTISSELDFSALFSGFNELSLIDALVLLDTPDLEEGNPGRDDQLAAKDAAYSLLFGFSDSVVLAGGAFGSIDTYSMVSFSTASSFGSPGISFTTNGPTGPVPEPTTWALMILGFGSAGAMLRRRRQSQTFAGT